MVTARTAIASARDPSRPSSLSPVARPAKKHDEPDPSPFSTFPEPHGDDAARRTRSSSASTTDIGGSTAGNKRGSHCVQITWYPTAFGSSASSPAASSGGLQSTARMAAEDPPSSSSDPPSLDPARADVSGGTGRRLLDVVTVVVTVVVARNLRRGAPRLEVRSAQIDGRARRRRRPAGVLGDDGHPHRSNLLRLGVRRRRVTGR